MTSQGSKRVDATEKITRTFFEASLLRGDIVIVLVNRDSIEAREAFGEDRLEVYLLLVAQPDRRRRDLNGRDLLASWRFWLRTLLGRVP